jgi:hypothetical protein
MIVRGHAFAFYQRGWRNHKGVKLLNPNLSAVCAAAVLALAWPQHGQAARRGAAGVNPIVCDGMLLGGSRNGRWLSAKDCSSSLHGGEKYHVYTLRGHIRETVGGKASAANSASGAQLGVIMTPEPNFDALCICANWNMLPRSVQAVKSPRQADLLAVRAVLSAHHMPRARSRIKQILETDLRGDGSRDVLIVATSSDDIGSGDDTPKRSEYSFVAAYHPGAPARAAIVGRGYFGADPKSQTDGPTRYRVLAIADLNGDGRMEVVIYGSVYEGHQVTVYAATQAGLRAVLSGGDGV